MLLVPRGDIIAHWFCSFKSFILIIADIPSTKKCKISASKILFYIMNTCAYILLCLMATVVHIVQSLYLLISLTAESKHSCPQKMALSGVKSAASLFSSVLFRVKCHRPVGLVNMIMLFAVYFHHI